MRRIRNFRSCLTDKQCEIFRKASISIQPSNTPVCRNLSTHDVIMVGFGAMAKENFSLVKGIKNV